MNWQQNWVMDQDGKLRGPYTYKEWELYSYHLWDLFHEAVQQKKEVFWHHLYFRNEEDFYAGSYNMFSKFHLLLINHLEGLDTKHMAYNNVTRGVDIYHNLMPTSRENAQRFRDKGKVMTMVAPHYENLKTIHKWKREPTDDELRLWEKQDEEIKQNNVRKNKKRIRKWQERPEYQNLTPEQVQAEAEERFNVWYPKSKNMPLFISAKSGRILAPDFPANERIVNQYAKFTINTLEYWLRSGAIYILEDHQKPDLATPPVFASMEKKGRLCSDGGILKTIEAYSINCCLEDLKKALAILQKDVYLTKCDDKVLFTFESLETVIIILAWFSFGQVSK